MSDVPQDNSQVEECKCEPGAPKWVVTFGDMMSLLLCFFVLLLSFSTTDIAKYKKMVGSLKDAFGISKNDPVQQFQTGDKIILEVTTMPKALLSLVAVRASAKKMAKKTKEVKTEAGADWLRIKVDGDALFDSGSTEIKPEAYPILSEIGDIINEFRGEVTIEGHTDSDIPVSGSYLNNYTVSSNRTISVLAYMIREKNVDRLKLVLASLADARPRETNDLPEGKAQNRRVEFVFFGKEKVNAPGRNQGPRENP